MRKKNQVTIGDLRLARPNSENIDFNLVLIYSFMYDLKSKIRTIKEEDKKSEIKHLRSIIRQLIFSKLLIDYFLDRISINANLNLIEFSTAQQEFTFNKSIDGGLGVSYMINPHLYIGVNWESFTTRQLQSYLKEQVGKQIQYNGNIISSSRELDIKNNDFFINRSLNGLSIKIIMPL
ncbi:MAG: hypothetical protein IPJ40_04360 [Saprospirales bacterium]|nr:hypothetical protein [Saprospirales bacterium]